MLFTSYFFLYSVSMLSVGFLIRGFYRGQSNAYYFIIPVFILFYIAPEFLDFLIGYKFTGPSSSVNMYLALSDQKTSIFYNLYITIVLMFFTYLMVINKNYNTNLAIDSSKKLEYFYKKYKYVLWLIMLVPLVLVLNSGSIDYYSTYTSRSETEIPEIHGFIGKVVLIATFLEALIISNYIVKSRNNNYLKYSMLILIVLLIALINSYIHGKRSIIVSFFMFLITLLYITNAVNRIRLSIILSLIVVTIIIFLQAYGKNVSDNLVATIQGLRIDFSRDYGVKFVIYNDLFHNNNILPYKGASYLFLLTFFIPRSIYLEKPYPYAVYFTNSSFGNFGGDYLYGWGLTTSFVSESISNLGWFGLLFFPWFYYIVISYLNKLSSINVHVVTYFVMILLLVIHPIAFIPILLIWLILLLKGNKKFVFRRP